ncbi:hypothetical protein DQ04_01761100 [Trypanosoma grayi]|uniref:hypothetical protein n=1 Tax=Trypanosoma grayi TaxID=71804 RepID=UPI0004F3EF61|nr:hypothetical protein DQ04_01761100 [Trypanosoma grayi]KEG12375.1 hypothetical protein DQ04_01761100 [Trypanosoma grayi]
MTQEFSLLHHLGVSVPDRASPTPQVTGSRDGNYRVLAPCKRPPVKEGTAAERSTKRRIPTAPLADFAGEVVEVRGRKNQADTDYIIYNARVPSIGAANMQLITEGQKRRTEESLYQLSPNVEYLQPHQRSDAAQRRLLTMLQNANREQAQRKLEEKQRERQRRLERETAELKRIEASTVKDDFAIAEKKAAEREYLKQAALEAVERKKQRAAEANSRGEVTCTAFPWDNPPQDGSRMRTQCLALVDANRELAEQAKQRKELTQMKERAKENAAVARTQALIGEERIRELRKKNELREMRRCKSAEPYETRAAQQVGYDGSYDYWFARSRSDGYARREKELKLREENRRLADEARKRQAEETARRVQQEKEMMARVARFDRAESHRQLAEKRRQQELVSKAALEAISRRRAGAQAHRHKSLREDLFFCCDDSKIAKEKRWKERCYYDDLKKFITTAQETRVGEKERDVAREKRLVQDANAAARRDAKRYRERAAQKQESYRMALQGQIESRKVNGERRSIAPHRGPEMRVLFRCPVTGKLLTPDQFGVTSPYSFGSRRTL